MISRDTDIAWDREHIIHPAYPIGENIGIVIAQGQGAILQDANGKEYIDACSQLTCVNLGYGRREIIDAAVEQLNKLQYTRLFHGLSNPTVIECARRLAKITPAGLTHFFFTAGGSESTEGAFRIARLYWHNRGKGKYKIISLYDSYHGISLGATTATGVGRGSSWRGIGPLPAGFIHIPSYDCYHCMFGKEYPSCNIQCARFLAETIEKEGPESVAAFIAEPELGVAGMIPPPSEYWPMVSQICKNYDVLLIADEVMTGFCRTGKMFGVDNWGIKPDIITVAKGLTSSYLPLGAAAFNDAIFDALKGTYFPGFTYGGHPVCAAAAIAAMKIYIKENIAENAAKLGKHVLKRLNAEFRPLPCVDNIGGLGLMLGMNVVSNKRTRTPLDPAVMAGIERRALDNGLIIRCMNATTSPGSRVCFTPPLTITIEEADRALDILQPIVAGLKPS